MKCVISGSFRRHLHEIMLLKEELEFNGIEVIKPVNIDTIDNYNNPEFIKFVGEEEKSEQQLQEEYDIAISNCDAHIIFNKDGYIGKSALRELCMGAGNNALSHTELKKGLSGKTYSQVYLIEPMSQGKLDEGVIVFINALIIKGNIKIGIESMYNDFGIKVENKSQQTY